MYSKSADIFLPLDFLRDICIFIITNYLFRSLLYHSDRHKGDSCQ